MTDNKLTRNPPSPSPSANEDEIKDFRLESFFPFLVRQNYRAVSEAIRGIYANLYGISVNQWRTMAVLHSFEPLSAKEIVVRSSMDKVNVSRAISSLQKSRLLERHIDPTDRRRVLLCLTRKGRSIMKDLIPRVVEAERQMLRNLTKDEQEVLIHLLQKVMISANEIEPPQLVDPVKQTQKDKV